MIERPILFSGLMVQAIQDNRKHMTRRTRGLDKINENPDEWETNGAWLDKNMYEFRNKNTGEFVMLKCPYGKHGDVLWVRETWAKLLAVSPATEEPNVWEGRYFKELEPPTKNLASHWNYDGIHVVYRADGEIEWCDGDGFHDETSHWRPSIHMPKAACRIKLKITDIRVERLQDITEEDAKAEGMASSAMDEGRVTNYARCWLSDLWNNINGAGAWDKNPWVWVVVFERVM